MKKLIVWIAWTAADVYFLQKFAVGKTFEAVMANIFALPQIAYIIAGLVAVKLIEYVISMTKGERKSTDNGVVVICVLTIVYLFCKMSGLF